MRGFLVSLGVHAAGVSALLAVPAFSTSDPPPATQAPPVTLPWFPTTVRVATPPLVTGVRAPRGHAATTAPRESSPPALPTISDAPLDPNPQGSSVLDPDVEAAWNGSSTPGDGPAFPGLPPGPGGGLPEPPRLVRAHVEVQPPRRIAGPDPVYPAIALMTRAQGRVILECTIATDGRVVDIRVLRGHPLFDSAAIFAVERWSYTPTLLNGVPVAALMTVSVDFRLR